MGQRIGIGAPRPARETPWHVVGIAIAAEIRVAAGLDDRGAILRKPMQPRQPARNRHSGRISDRAGRRAGHPALPADGLVLVDSTTCKAHRAASGAAHSTAEAASRGRSRGGISSKIHACTDGLGRILRLIDSPGHHADLRADLAAHGCTVHTPPKQGMRNPPPWDKAIYARRHQVETLFCRLKDQARIALRRDKTRRSWIGG